MSDGALVERLQRDVADRQPVDWPALMAELQATNAAEPGLLHEVSMLKLLDEIGDAHRTFQSAPDDDPEPTQALDAPADDTLEAWGRYLLDEKVGRGGFGSVYRAWDPVLEMPVAIKILHRRYGDARLKERLLSEGRALAQVRHPNVVRVLNVEQHDGRLGLVMEFLPGETMDALVEAQGVLDDREASLIVEDVCRALTAVHDNGLIHRDVKARNIIREKAGRIVLMDFGAGLSVRAAQEAGTAVGTPLYMAPEMLTGAPATPACDVYGVGVLLFYLVTGRFPYEGGSFQEIHDAHAARSGNALQALRPDLPARFVRIVDRALALDPQARFQTPDALLEALLDARDAAEGGRWRTVRWLAIGALALLASVALSGVLTSAVYDSVLRRQAYAQETLLQRVVYGAKGIVMPLALSLMGVGLVGGLIALRRIAVATSSAIRAFDGRVARRARTLAARLSLTEPGVCSAWLMLATMLAAVAIWVYWLPLFQLMPLNIATAPPESLSMLSPAHTSYRTWYRYALSLLIAANLAGWLGVTRLARRARRLPPSTLATEVAIVALLFLSMQFPYRLLHDVQNRPTVMWRGQHCFVLGERPADTLLFCARLMPRLVVVPKVVGPLPPSNANEHPFAPFSPDR